MSKDVDAPKCQTCGGPCQVPAWARDGSWYSNNPGKFAAAIVRNHDWFRPKRLAAVSLVVAQTRALPAGKTFPCVKCGRFAFTDPQVVCFWCRKGG